MATFTRLQLRTPVTDSANFSGARDFELVNNLNTTAYFNIEGTDNKDIFNTASLTSLVNCSVVSESTQAAFIINPNATATFTFTPSSTISSGSIQFRASNPLVVNLDDLTSSGSAFGVNLDTDA
tara:strand:+ start:591 stop:962 length:372 start_codon:yes stop_codon:yes gene_type:complete